MDDSAPNINILMGELNSFQIQLRKIFLPVWDQLHGSKIQILLIQSED